MSFSSQANPNVVKTALDDVFKQSFEPQTHPGWAGAESSLAFRQRTIDNAANIEEIFKGVSLWDSRLEEADVPSDDPRIDNKITFNVANYSKSVDVPKNFFDDNMHGAWEKQVEDFGRKGRVTMDDNAYKVYRDGFTTTLTADGVALFSSSHTTISGDTVDNLETAALTPTSLNTLIVSLMEQKDQAGVVMGNPPKTLLVPPALFKKACEVVESELLADSTDNNINVYSSKYGIFVAMSNRLGAAIGGNGSDAAHFLLGQDHSVTRWIRQGMETVLVPWQNQRNNNYIYKGEFREVVGALDYVGTVASNGTT